MKGSPLDRKMAILVMEHEKMSKIGIIKSQNNGLKRTLYVVGAFVVGELVGDSEGPDVGLLMGLCVGTSVGPSEGESVGLAVGD